VSVLGVKNENHGATGVRKKFDNIFSHLDTMHQRDGYLATAKTALTHSVAICAFV